MTVVHELPPPVRGTAVRTGDDVRTSAEGSAAGDEPATSTSPATRTRFVAVAGGVAAQGSQAVASVTLHVFAARALGVSGLGRFGTLFALIVLATALCSGFVGDSLIVLERHRADIRAALQAWLVIIALAAGALGGAGVLASGALSLPGALAFAGAMIAFLGEDTLRRLLMANMRFWRIVIVDLASLAVSVLVVAVASVIGDLSISHFFVALCCGQLAAGAVAWSILPAGERYLSTRRDAALGAVARYGAWRALQQAIRPAVLAAARLIGLVAVGAVAAGQLEAARIYMAPAMLLVAGVGSFLFASYAARRDDPLHQLVRVADRSVATLFAVVGAFALGALLLVDRLGPLLTDGRYELSGVAIAGWGLYAAAVAASTPYAQLAAVRGRQVAVVAVRIGDAAVSCAAAITVVALGGSLAWVPVVLAAGAVLGGLVVRHVVLGPSAGSSMSAQVAPR